MNGINYPESPVIYSAIVGMPDVAWSGLDVSGQVAPLVK